MAEKGSTKSVDIQALVEEHDPKVLRAMERDAGLHAFEMMPYMRYDEDEKKLVCADRDLADLIRLVSNGNPERIRRILDEDGIFRRQILQDKTHWIKMLVLSKQLKELTKGEKSQQASNIILSIIKMMQPQKSRHARPKTAKGTLSLERELLGVEREGEAG